jgi:hypothetical protein
MRLIDLEPELLKISGHNAWRKGASIVDADGVMFLCPQCFKNNNGNVGTHMMICWKPYVDPETTPKPGRWNLEGTNFEDFTIAAGPSGQSSVLIQGGCNAHFYIRNGEVIFT